VLAVAASSRAPPSARIEPPGWTTRTASWERCAHAIGSLHARNVTRAEIIDRGTMLLYMVRGRDHETGMIAARLAP